MCHAKRQGTQSVFLISYFAPANTERHPGRHDGWVAGQFRIWYRSVTFRMWLLCESFPFPLFILPLGGLWFACLPGTYSDTCGSRTLDGPMRVWGWFPLTNPTPGVWRHNHPGQDARHGAPISDVSRLISRSEMKKISELSSRFHKSPFPLVNSFCTSSPPKSHHIHKLGLFWDIYIIIHFPFRLTHCRTLYGLNRNAFDPESGSPRGSGCLLMRHEVMRRHLMKNVNVCV